MALEVVDAAEQNRYEARDGDEVVGFAEYRKTPSLIVFTHTIVEPAHEGEGVGGTLVRGALDDVRRQGLAVVPQCSFVRSWIERHPDYADLVGEAPGATAD